MQNQTLTPAGLTAAAVLGAATVAEAKPAAKKKGSGGRKPEIYAAEYKGAPDAAALEKAIERLKTFDWGTDIPKFHELLGAIEDAVPGTHGDAAARKALESKLAAALTGGPSRAAKDYICRKLAVIGTAESVPALAALLSDKDSSHTARYALERIPAPEAAAALREALTKTSGAQKAGVAGSLGARRDAESVSSLVSLVGDSDTAVALAAATALGDIGTLESAKALQDAQPASDAVKLRVADARLTAGERLLAAGDKAGALGVYKSLVASPVKSVKIAATRGLLMASGKKG